MRFKSVFWRRLSITAGLLFLTRVAASIPVPGLNGNALSAWCSFMPSDSSYAMLVEPYVRSQFSILAVGIWPYLMASVVLLVLSGLIPALRKMRQGTLQDHRRFDTLILVAAFLGALVQSYATSRQLIGLGVLIPGLAFSHTAWFTIVATATLTAGTMLLIWIARAITRFGLGNGVVWIMIVAWLHPLPQGIRQHITMWNAENRPMAHWVLLVVFTLAVFAGAVALVHARRELKAVPKGNLEEDPVNIPLRINLAGVVPVIIINQMFNILGLQMQTIDGYSPNLPFASWVLGVRVCLVMVLTLVLSAYVLNVRGLFQSLRRWGYTLSEYDEDESSIRRIEKSMVGPVVIATLALSLLGVLPHLLTTRFGFAGGLATLYGPFCLILVAVASELRGQVMRYRSVGGQVEPDEELAEGEWVVLTECETELEVELIRRRLADAQIDSDWEVNRAIPIAGTLAPWEVCSPSKPSLVIHRRLAGGIARVWICADDLTRAESLLGLVRAVATA